MFFFPLLHRFSHARQNFIFRQPVDVHYRVRQWLFSRGSEKNPNESSYLKVVRRAIPKLLRWVSNPTHNINRLNKEL